MGNLQEKALIAYERIKAKRGEVTFIDAFIEGYTQANKDLTEYTLEGELKVEKTYNEWSLLTDSIETHNVLKKVGSGKIKILIVKE